MVGKGSVNHNSRRFKAENIDGERSHLNVDYCNENIRQVYHVLFDGALKRYNDKQTRADRRIGDYYRKIENSKQEKPFHELILQIGDKESMGVGSAYSSLAREVLDEYYQGFQARNPNLYVFSAHLHMDEATPHLHIDFVPFTTGSRRGLDTRVSLKQALAALGFRGGTRGDTEWNQWVRSEKEQLAVVMGRHDIEWEHRGTHEKHLSVLEYKKREREKEVVRLEKQIVEKKENLQVLSERVLNYDKGVDSLKTLEQMLEDSPEYRLSDPLPLMTAKVYKNRIVEPFIEKLKLLAKAVLVKSYEGWDSYYRLNITNRNLYRENERLTEANARLVGENKRLCTENKDYKLLRKVFGRKQVDSLLEQAKAVRQSKQRGERFGNNREER